MELRIRDCRLDNLFHEIAVPLNVLLVLSDKALVPDHFEESYECAHVLRRGQQEVEYLSDLVFLNQVPEDVATEHVEQSPDRFLVKLCQIVTF